jgi:hypothetical protein
MFVSSSGNVGIGTNNPTQKLHVSGGNAFVNGTIYFGDGNHYLTTDNSTYALFSSNRNLQLGRSGVAALTVVSTNNVLIGTTTDSARLTVRGSGATSSTTALRVENTNGSASLVVKDNGFVGIGTASPAYLLDITGSDSLINISPQASGNAIVINNSGYIKWENASLDTYMRCSNGFGLSDNGFNSKFSIAFGGTSVFNTGQNFSFQTGNVLVGTTTDSGFRLDVSGSGRFTNGLTVTGSLIVSGTYGGINTVSNKPNLFDLNEITRVEWANGYLNSTTGDTTVDWENKVLIDSTNASSINWENRALYTPNGVEAFNYASYNDDVASSRLYTANYIGNQQQQNLTVYAKSSGQIIGGTIDASVTAYDIMYLDTDGTWKPLKNLPTVSTKMLGIETDDSILIEGDVTVSDDGSVGTYVVSASYGLPVYLSDTLGQLTTVVPGTGVIRVVGHIYYQSTVSSSVWLMKFRPSNDWT